MMFRFLFGAFIILLGLGFLFDVNLLRFLIPLFLIIIGIRIITGNNRNWDMSKRSESKDDSFKRVAIFSPINERVSSDNFQRAEAVAVFGGGEIDLSQAKTKAKQVNLELVAVFGGLKVIVPKNWKVSSEGIGIIGGFSNNTKGDGAVVNVKLEGVAIFGGVEVVN
jgi:predicted membrane protein